MQTRPIPATATLCCECPPAMRGNTMLLEGKKAIITGGTRGIGYAIACRFIEEGASVTVFGSRQETADAAVEKLTAAYPDA
ncbi:MAG: SDR family NAD(P)-dependent oxidoreductase, partial [Collinsella sp.]|nr:SDR family NAD(P)-dependent oxidoreductase [Collinsella sp.]